MTDPERATVLIKVRFDSLDGADHDVEIEFDPQLYNDGSDDVGWTRGHALLAHDRRIASALVARPALTRTSSGYKGHTDEPPGAHLRRAAARQRRPAGPHPPDRPRRAQGPDARARLRPARLGGAGRRARLARRRLRRRRRRLQAGLASTTATSCARSPPPRCRSPRPTRPRCWCSRPTRTRTTRARSSPRPSMPWGWGELRIDAENPRSAPVPPRLGARPLPDRHGAAGGGRRPAANRALDFLFDRQQLDDGSFPQNTQVDGTPKWKSLQMDQVGLPIVLAWQLNRASRAGLAPRPQGRRLDRREGPGLRAGALGEPGGLLAGDDRGGDRRPGLRRRHREPQRRRQARRDLPRARPTAGPRTSSAGRRPPTAPTQTHPYYLRVTKDRKPNRGTKYAIGDSGPSKIDQRRVVDVSFLELVRLGVKRAGRPGRS